jgi:hypothetical protein
VGLCPVWTPERGPLGPRPQTPSKSRREGDVEMAYETKVILKMISQIIGNASSLRDAYEKVVDAASVEGLELPDYDTYQQKFNKKED